MTEGLLQLAEEALTYMRRASRGGVGKDDLPEPEIRKGADWQTLHDKGKKAIDLLPDLHKRQNYTLVVELSLYSMERLAEAAMKRNYYVADSTEHGRIFEDAASLGVLDPELAAYLSRLFRYRSQLYYRSGIGTRELSDKLSQLANGFYSLMSGGLTE